MATELIGSTHVYDDYSRSRLDVVGGEAGRLVEGSPELALHEQMDRYFELREAAKAEKLPEPEDVAGIQAVVNMWLAEELSFDNLRYEYYRSNQGEPQPYDRGAVDRSVRLNNFLRANFSDIIPATVLDASDAFINMTIGTYDAYLRGEKIAEQAEGRFAFLVPARAERNRPQDSRETIDPYPNLRYVPDALRVAMYAGLPPFVVDRYLPDEHGKPAYMILAPVFPDMQNPDSGLSKLQAMKIAKEAVNDAVRLAHRMFGVKVMGLGATLPALTRYGKSIKEEGVVTTTGHGGTVALILQTIQALQQHEAVRKDATKRIGVLGLGSIGASIAEVLGAIYSDAQITIYDLDEEKVKATAKALAPRKDGTVICAKGDPRQPEVGVREVIENSDIIVSALSGRVDLRSLGIRLDGKAIIDDTQPPAFDLDQLLELGGLEAWPIGENPDGNVIRHETTWQYGESLLPGGLFGCEIEAAVLAKRLVQLEQNKELRYVIDTDTGERVSVNALELIREFALQGPVTAESALRFKGYFEQDGIVAATTLQAEGRATVIPSRATVERDPAVYERDAILADIEQGRVPNVTSIRQHRLRRMLQHLGGHALPQEG